MTLLLFAVTAVLFATLIALLVVRRVQDMEAVVVRERLTGKVTGLHIGPCLYWRVPGLDDIKTLDLHFHRTTFDGQTIQTTEGLAATVTVTVGWQQRAHLLAQVALREVLPFLPDTEAIVEKWIQFTVRSALSRRRLGSLLAAMTNAPAFEESLKNDLQARLEVLGIEVLNLNLICLPSPAVVAARISAEARAEEVRTLAEAHATETIALAQARAEEVRALAAADADRIRLLSDALAAGKAGEKVIDLLVAEGLLRGDKNVLASVDVGARPDEARPNRNGRRNGFQVVMPVYHDQEPYGY